MAWKLLVAAVLCLRLRDELRAATKFQSATPVDSSSGHTTRADELARVPLKNFELWPCRQFVTHITVSTVLHHVGKLRTLDLLCFLH